jgi:hypothetical protein
MQKFKHKIDSIEIMTKTFTNDQIRAKIEEREVSGWEHYDTIISPTYDKDYMVYLFFKKQASPRLRMDIVKNLNDPKRSKMKMSH